MLSLVFPGQGSQYIGMGKDFSNNFPVANKVYQEVDEVLEFSLSKLIFDGKIEDLTLTQNAQPAIMATSIAILKTLESEGFNILKTLFVDYAKSKLSKKQMFFLYIKIHSMDTNTEIYNIMNKWIRNNSNEIIKQFLNI